MSVTNLGIEGLDHLEQIGSGGSSRVYRARQSDLDRVVAVKVINSGQDPDVARRFDRERKAMGRLSNHEGIVPVYTTGITPFGESYLVMPYYPSGSIQDQIDKGPLDWRHAVAYVDVAAETMAAAHEEGVVHLDIKPANILLTDAGAPRIADFGIAKLASGSGVAARTTGTAFTPAYSAPETFLDGQATPAADVYGLGATLWACLVGHPPFLGPGDDTKLMAVIGRVVNNPLGDVRHLAPEPICRVINEAMAKDPHQRFPSARQFSAALKSAMAEVGLGAANSADTGGNGAFGGEQPTSHGADNTALHQFVPPVPYGAGPDVFLDHEREPARVGDHTQLFVEQPVAPTVASARTVHGGQAVMSAPAAPEMGRSLLQPTADASRYHGGPPPIVERTPLVDLDRFRFGPIVAGLTALIVVALLAGWALTRGDSTSQQSGVASDSEENPPSGPETDEPASVGDSIDLSPNGATSSSATSTSTSTTSTTTPQTTAAETTATSSTTESTSTTEATTSSSTSTTEATTSSTSTTEATSSSSSSSSTSTTSTTTVVVGPLMPPENVAAVADNGDVTLSWTEPTTGPEPSSYVIYRNGELLAAADASPYLDAGLEPGTYRYRVAAIGPSATESDLSLPAAVDIPIPVPLTVTASLSGSTRTSLTIRVVSAPCMANVRVSYVIEGSGDTPELITVDHNPCVLEDTVRIRDLRPNETYRVNVTATGTDGGTGAALPMRLTPQ